MPWHLVIFEHRNAGHFLKISSICFSCHERRSKRRYVPAQKQSTVYDRKCINNFMLPALHISPRLFTRSCEAASPSSAYSQLPAKQRSESSEKVFILGGRLHVNGCLKGSFAVTRNKRST